MLNNCSSCNVVKVINGDHYGDQEVVLGVGWTILFLAQRLKKLYQAFEVALRLQRSAYKISFLPNFCQLKWSAQLAAGERQENQRANPTSHKPENQTAAAATSQPILTTSCQPRSCKISFVCCNPFKIMSSKKISLEPDVTVVVGSGENQQEFQCYGVILASASPVLDAMLSSGMSESTSRRIEFPNKDPEEWKLFERCIDPAGASLINFDYVGHDDNEFLNESTARMLVANYFHELAMEQYLKKCDDILYPEVVKEAKLSKVIDLLAFSNKYNLSSTRKYAEKVVAKMLEKFCWGLGGTYQFDLLTVEKLVEAIRPFKLREIERSAKKPRTDGVSKGILDSCDFPNLWGQISSVVTDDLSVLPLEEVNRDRSFSRIVYYALQRNHESMVKELNRISAKLIGSKTRCGVKIDNDTMCFKNETVNYPELSPRRVFSKHFVVLQAELSHLMQYQVNSPAGTSSKMARI